MDRRAFTATTLLGLASIESLEFHAKVDSAVGYKSMIKSLLATWVDGLLSHQIIDISDPTRHGGLACPSCGFIHGRCIDAIYPFIYMAQTTQDKKYLKAAERLFEWSKNVSTADGAFTVMPDPKTWNGISVFGAIALSETLKFHGDFLPKSFYIKIENRLKEVAEFIYKTFTMTFTNVNYGYSAVYGLHILGEVLKNEKYTIRSKELAKEIKNFLTKPNSLVFGEAKPSDIKSEKGFYGIDLGYNVEETLPNVVQYAHEVHDKDLLELLTKALEGHLEFLMPDGAWDNSWGTRMAKWSYWGSRTTDGCQLAYTLLAAKRPSFRKAVFKNTYLMKLCTKDNLLHGGPHYVSHGMKPCIHHTFSHAKVLCTLLNLNINLKLINEKGTLPRETNYGFKKIEEIDAYLVSKNDWISIISAYDFIYKKHAIGAMGGTLGILYHKNYGPVLSSSMAKYMAVEVFNQQPTVGTSTFPLSIRVELVKINTLYSNLYYKNAEIKIISSDIVKVNTTLCDEDGNAHPERPIRIELIYKFLDSKFEVEVRNLSNFEEGLNFIIPLISENKEKVIKNTPHSLTITKGKSELSFKSSESFDLITKREFNLVPGFEALPIKIAFPKADKSNINCNIKIN